eukprot:15423-Eustigmatos_ZCMA.PRE.1
MSISAFAVLARILAESRLIGVPIGEYHDLSTQRLLKYAAPCQPCEAWIPPCVVIWGICFVVYYAMYALSRVLPWRVGMSTGSLALSAAALNDALGWYVARPCD